MWRLEHLPFVDSGWEAIVCVCIVFVQWEAVWSRTTDIKIKGMMIIAFITINSSLVPSIEARVYALRFFWIWDISITFTSFAFLYWKKTYVNEKKQLVQDLIPPPGMYTHMCTLYTYTNTYMPRFSPSGFFGPSRCLVPTPGLTSEYPMCSVCVCVCAYTHTYTYVHFHPRQKIEKRQTTPLSLLLSKITHHAKRRVLSID